jgi:hypothetical protein
MMTVPARVDSSRWFAGRTDVSRPVSCTTCGCRLTDAPGLTGTAWRHFQTSPDTDARGCRPRCLEDLHDRTGYPISARDAGRLITLRDQVPIDPYAITRETAVEEDAA